MGSKSYINFKTFYNDALQSVDGQIEGISRFQKKKLEDVLRASGKEFFKYVRQFIDGESTPEGFTDVGYPEWPEFSEQYRKKKRTATGSQGNHFFKYRDMLSRGSYRPKGTSLNRWLKSTNPFNVFPEPEVTYKRNKNTVVFTLELFGGITRIGLKRNLFSEASEQAVKIYNAGGGANRPLIEPALSLFYRRRIIRRAKRALLGG